MLRTLLVALVWGCAPEQRRGSSWFDDVGDERGIEFTFHSGHQDRYLMPEIVGGGGALFDLEGDGDLDAYLIQGGSLTVASGIGNQLFENNGNGHFENISTGSGAEDSGYGMGVASGDYDNDGRTDLYITNVGRNTLLRNAGNSSFEDVTGRAGVGDERWGTSTAFLDYDADGDLDLFVSNYVDWSKESELTCSNALGEPDYCHPNHYKAPTEDVLYRNEGDGRFTDVSRAAGVAAGRGNGLGVVCGDFNLDGWTDVFVANDTNLDHLWINQADASFRDEALERGCALDDSGRAKAGMGVSAVDVDDNATLDLLVVNLRRQSDSFFLNDGSFFSDATSAVGLVWDRGVFTRFGVGIVDFDNDSWLDLYVANGSIGSIAAIEPYSSTDRFAEPNLLFRGKPGVKFEEVSPRGGVSEPLIATSRAAVFGDVDNDGGLDLLVVNRDAKAYLLRNSIDNRGNWISFRVLNQHGSDALGAVLKARVGAVAKRREVRTTYSFLAANDPRIHLGLGDVERATEVAVRWPDGGIELFGDFDSGQVVTLRQGNGK